MEKRPVEEESTPVATVFSGMTSRGEGRGRFSQPV